MDRQIFTEHGMNTKKDLEIPLITIGSVLDIVFFLTFTIYTITCILYFFYKNFVVSLYVEYF